MNQKKALGLISLIGAAFVGGGLMPSLIRAGTQTITPFIFNWLRVALSLIILVPILITKKYQFKKLFKKDNLSLFITLGLSVGLNITLFSYAIAHTTLVASQLIYVLVPITTSFLAFIFIKEKINLQKTIGMAVSVVGVLILIIFSRSPAERASLGTFYGNFLIFIAMLGYSTYLTFSKKHTADKSALEMAFITNSALTILFTPLAIFDLLDKQVIAQISSTSLLAAITLSIVALIFILLVQVAIKNLSASTASLSTVLSPEFAALTGFIVYHEKISSILLLSLVLAVSGVIISTNSQQRSIFDRIKL